MNHKETKKALKKLYRNLKIWKRRYYDLRYEYGNYENGRIIRYIGVDGNNLWDCSHITDDLETPSIGLQGEDAVNWLMRETIPETGEPENPVIWDAMVKAAENC